MIEKTYKIKLEDKAAFLNRLEKAGVNVDSYRITDNKFKGYFEITFVGPENINKAKTILRQSPKIDRITELIYKMVQEEVSK